MNLDATGAPDDVSPTTASMPASGVESTPSPAVEGVPFGANQRRENVLERRSGLDRRILDMGAPTGLERRRGPGRRRSDERRSAEEGEMTSEQFEFVMAIEAYKRINNRPFPSWTEVLEVLRQLGYRKVASSTLHLPPSSPTPVGPPTASSAS